MRELEGRAGDEEEQEKQEGEPRSQAGQKKEKIVLLCFPKEMREGFYWISTLCSIKQNAYNKSIYLYGLFITISI